MPTVSYNVAASTDDARNISGDSTFNGTVASQHIGKFGATDFWNGFRWLAVAVPQGATITSATLDMYSAGLGSGTTVPAIFYGEDADDTVTFTNSTAGKPEGRTRTTASVAKTFDPAAWGSGFTGFGIDIVDVTSIVQEIVSRAGWASGNDMVIVGHDNGSADNNYIGVSTWNSATNRGALLTITYSTGETNLQTSQNVTVTESVGLNVPGYSYSINKSENVSVTESRTASILTTGTLSISKSESVTVTESVSVTPTGGAFTANIQAWVYPGSPAEDGDEEYRDGRKIHALKPEYYTVNSSGVLTQLTDPTNGENAYSVANANDVKAYSHRQFFTISSNAANMATLVISPTRRTNAVNTIKSFLDTTGFTGVELDWEGFGSWTPTSYANYKTFVTQLGNTLHQYGYKLMIDGPPIGNTTEQSYYDFVYEDFESLPVDYLAVMAYDYQYDYGGGESVAPVAWVEDICDWVKTKVTDIDRIVIGMPSYGYHATTAGFDITIDTKDQSAAHPGYATATRNADYEMTWTNGGNSYVYQDTTGINAKRQVIEAKGIKHISVWHLGGNDWFTGDEPVNPVMSQLVTVTEATTVTIASTTDLSISKSESVSVSESLARSSDTRISVSESATVSESLARVLESLIGVSDSTTITETLTPLLVHLIDKSESVTVTESVTRMLTGYISKSESVALTESVGVNQPLNKSLSDTVTLSESQNVAIVPGSGITQTVSLTEAVQVMLQEYLISKSESVSVTESRTVSAEVTRSVSDTAAVSESVGRMVQSHISKSEAITVSESVASSYHIGLITGENVSVAESVSAAPTAGPNDISGTASDTVTTSEGLGYYSETAFTRESITIQVAEAGSESGTIAEDITVSESVQTSIDNYLTATETTTVTESVQVALPTGGDTIAELVTVTESVTVSPQEATALTISESELIGLYESLGENMVYNGSFDAVPPFTAPTTTNSAYINGTAGGDATDGRYGWRTGFFGSGSAQFDTAETINGKASLKVTSTPGAIIEIRGDIDDNTYSTLPGRGFLFRPNTSYTLGGWIKIANASGSGTSGVNIAMVGANSDGSPITTRNITTHLTNDQSWTYHSTTFTTGATEVRGHLELRIYGHGGAATFAADVWYGDISLLPTVMDSQEGDIETTVSPAVADTTTVTDTPLLTHEGSNIEVSDTVAVSEETDSLIPPLGSVYELVTVSESVALNIPLTVAKSESISVGEGLTLQRPDANTPQILASESVTVTESVSGQPSVRISVADTATHTEYVYVQEGGADLYISVSQSVSVSTAVTVARIVPKRPKGRPVVVDTVPDTIYNHAVSTAIKLTRNYADATTIKSVPTSSSVKSKKSSDVYLT